MEAVARIEGSKRDAIVKLITQGMEPEDAIAEVAGAPGGRRADGPAFEGAAGPDGTDEAEDRLTGNEWVEHSCVEILALLTGPAVRATFVAHARLYRARRDVRQALKDGTKKAMDAARVDGLHGGFYSIVSQLVNVAHPRHWLRCGGCNGPGSASPLNGQDHRRCSGCRGNGFEVKFEWS